MKRIISLILVCLTLIPAFAGCASNRETLADAPFELLATEETYQEIVKTPTEKAYVRNGEWADKNWMTINQELGYNQNNAEPLVFKGSGSPYTRYVYFTFDISEFKNIDYKKILFSPAFTKVGAMGNSTYKVYSLSHKYKFLFWTQDNTSDNWKTSTITWNNQPYSSSNVSSGKVKLVAENCIVGGMAPIDLTSIVTTVLSEGKTKFSLVMVPDTQQGEGENQIDWRTTTLTATTSDSTALYKTNLVEDEAENQAIWDWAQQMYDEWYPRYEYLLQFDRPLSVEDVSAENLIPVDENEYTKTIMTTGTGSTKAVGIETTKWTDEDFKKAEPTRTVASLIGLGEYSDYTVEQKFDKYGGIIDEQLRQEETGFFYRTKIGDRWWIIDPLGYPCFIRAVSGFGINYLSSPNHTAAAIDKVGSDAKWGIAATRQLMDDWGFNASTSNGSLIKDVPNRTIYQGSTGFVGSYGTHIGTNNSIGGNTTFAGNNTMNVFDPAFVDWCDEKAQSVVSQKDDPYLLGRTMDNELPIDSNMLYNYLRLSPADELYHYSYATAWTWLINMTGKQEPTEADITEELLDLFVGFVYDRFYYLGSSAIRKYDPNHMVLGSRLLSGFMNQPWVLRFAGLHLDCLTFNWYGEWDIPPENLAFVSENANAPFMITEFYTKGMDSGLDNTRGAGWVVKTQQERGDFYQCYTLRLLECKNIVGWHWFQYLDNDPDPAVIYKEVDGVLVWKDQSSVDANKGIVSNTHEPYTDLVNSMTEINKNVYKLIDHFDAKYAQTAD